MLRLADGSNRSTLAGPDGGPRISGVHTAPIANVIAFLAAMISISPRCARP
jgi:hypothetical protein